jgi:hypothetical protein
MSWGFVAVAGATVVGAVINDKGARDAGKASDKGAQAGILEQQKQLDEVKALLAPYSAGGTEALNAQRALLGLTGNDAQQTAINQLQSSPRFTSMVNQGESAILQNASATGGLRGGNTQSALAQFRPQMLNELIQQQFANLGGISNQGLNASMAQGTAGMQAASNIGNIITGNATNQGNMAVARAGNASNAVGVLGGQVGGLF